MMELKYSKMLMNLVEQMVEYKKALIVVVRGSDLKTFDFDHHFFDLAKHAFMYKLKDLYEFNKTEFTDQYHIDSKAIDSLMEDVKSILKKEERL